MNASLSKISIDQPIIELTNTEPSKAGVLKDSHTPWSVEKANDWYSKHEWMVGANFLPSTAINQLEFWQADTFDPSTIDKELGWARDIGFNTMRVSLHSLAWKQDPGGFKDRLDTYLTIAHQHGIKTIFVFFDDCFNVPKPGRQPEPIPGKTNSGWLQDPGYPLCKDESIFPDLEAYVKDVLTKFKSDERVLMWDLYNEPGNHKGKDDSSLNLLKHVFQWAREINPDHPLTSGIWFWDGFTDNLNLFQIQNSDVITYHNYEEPHLHQRMISMLKLMGRPLICTEYMARTRNSRFSNILRLLKANHVGAINWGLVWGKSNTIYEWSKTIADGSQPDEWFHDIFYPNGQPYRQDEIDLIRKLTARLD